EASPPVTPPGAATAGALIRTPHYEIRASLPEECSPPDPALGSAATRRVGVEITLEPTSDVQVPANPYYARLVDAEHDVYEATLGGCGTPLAPALPARGQPAHGWIVFELPRAARATALTYAPELVGVPKTELVIDLRR
ncbi:MAG TPA: hypothetical protein VMG12_29225, partial [Polyangiaceae bacterium]|nr:hypothetical protein [Polyangiaceae bacterium]